eukprot:353725-Chlamydomonas_euryale.AAC.6
MQHFGTSTSPESGAAVDAQVAAASEPLDAPALTCELSDVVHEPLKKQQLRLPKTLRPNSVLNFLSVAEKATPLLAVGAPDPPPPGLQAHCPHFGRWRMAGFGRQPGSHPAWLG